MQAIGEELRRLAASPLYAYRQEQGYHPVLGEGDLNAGLMFIGEAPGASEAKSGRPFVGAAGMVLSELLASIGLERPDVYITNIVKDRPPENRDPTGEEIELYAPLLKRQIEIIQPRVIATLGRFAMDFILQAFRLPEQGEKISDLHGKALRTQADYGSVWVVPLYHPAVALYNQGQREVLRADFQILKGLIEQKA